MNARFVPGFDNGKIGLDKVKKLVPISGVQKKEQKVKESIPNNWFYDTNKAEQIWFDLEIPSNMSISKGMSQEEIHYRKIDDSTNKLRTTITEYEEKDQKYLVELMKIIGDETIVSDLDASGLLYEAKLKLEEMIDNHADFTARQSKLLDSLLNWFGQTKENQEKIDDDDMVDISTMNISELGDDIKTAVQYKDIKGETVQNIHQSIVQRLQTRIFEIKNELQQNQKLISQYETHTSGTSAKKRRGQMRDANINIDNELEISQRKILELNAQIAKLKSALTNSADNAGPTPEAKGILDDVSVEVNFEGNNLSVETEIEIEARIRGFQEEINNLRAENASFRDTVSKMNRTEISMERRIMLLEKQKQLADSKCDTWRKKYNQLERSINDKIRLAVADAIMERQKQEESSAELEGFYRERALQASEESRLMFERRYKENQANFQNKLNDIQKVLNDGKSDDVYKNLVGHLTNELEEQRRLSLSNLEELKNLCSSQMTEMSKHYESIITKLSKNLEIMRGSVESQLKYMLQDAKIEFEEDYNKKLLEEKSRILIGIQEMKCNMLQRIQGLKTKLSQVTHERDSLRIVIATSGIKRGTVPNEEDDEKVSHIEDDILVECISVLKEKELEQRLERKFTMLLKTQKDLMNDSKEWEIGQVKVFYKQQYEDFLHVFRKDMSARVHELSKACPKDNELLNKLIQNIIESVDANLWVERSDEPSISLEEVDTKISELKDQMLVIASENELWKATFDELGAEFDADANALREMIRNQATQIHELKAEINEIKSKTSMSSITNEHYQSGSTADVSDKNDFQLSPRTQVVPGDEPSTSITACNSPEDTVEVKICYYECSTQTDVTNTSMLYMDQQAVRNDSGASELTRDINLKSEEMLVKNSHKSQKDINTQPETKIDEPHTSLLDTSSSRTGKAIVTLKMISTSCVELMENDQLGQSKNEGFTRHLLCPCCSIQIDPDSSELMHRFMKTSLVTCPSCSKKVVVPEIIDDKGDNNQGYDNEESEELKRAKEYGKKLQEEFEQAKCEYNELERKYIIQINSLERTIEQLQYAVNIFNVEHGVDTDSDVENCIHSNDRPHVNEDEEMPPIFIDPGISKLPKRYRSPYIHNHSSENKNHVMFEHKFEGESEGDEGHEQSSTIKFVSSDLEHGKSESDIHKRKKGTKLSIKTKSSVSSTYPSKTHKIKSNDSIKGGILLRPDRNQHRKESKQKLSVSLNDHSAEVGADTKQDKNVKTSVKVEKKQTTSSTTSGSSESIKMSFISRRASQNVTSSVMKSTPLRVPNSTKAVRSMIIGTTKDISSYLSSAKSQLNDLKESTSKLPVIPRYVTTAIVALSLEWEGIKSQIQVFVTKHTEALSQLKQQILKYSGAFNVHLSKMMEEQICKKDEEIRRTMENINNVYKDNIDMRSELEQVREENQRLREDLIRATTNFERLHILLGNNDAILAGLQENEDSRERHIQGLTSDVLYYQNLEQKALRRAESFEVKSNELENQLHFCTYRSNKRLSGDASQLGMQGSIVIFDSELDKINNDNQLLKDRQSTDAVPHLGSLHNEEDVQDKPKKASIVQVQRPEPLIASFPFARKSALRKPQSVQGVRMSKKVSSSSGREPQIHALPSFETLIPIDPLKPNKSDDSNSIVAYVTRYVRDDNSERAERVGENSSATYSRPSTSNDIRSSVTSRTSKVSGASSQLHIEMIAATPATSRTTISNISGTYSTKTTESAPIHVDTLILDRERDKQLEAANKRIKNIEILLNERSIMMQTAQDKAHDLQVALYKAKQEIARSIRSKNKAELLYKVTKEQLERAFELITNRDKQIIDLRKMISDFSTIAESIRNKQIFTEQISSAKDSEKNSLSSKKQALIDILDKSKAFAANALNEMRSVRKWQVKRKEIMENERKRLMDSLKASSWLVEKLSLPGVNVFKPKVSTPKKLKVTSSNIS